MAITSTNLRNVVFPGHATIKRLSLLRNAEDLGFFTLDKIWITFNQSWKVEEIVGYKRGSERCYNKDKKFVGTLHFREHSGIKFQIFQGKGQNRNIQFNPRHFSSLTKLQCFAREIIAGRDYHITHIDFSWLLKKKIFSTSSLLWSMRVKNMKLRKRYEYVSEPIKLMDIGKYQGLYYGGKNKRVKFYDTDEYNTESSRQEIHKIHDRINFEIGLGREILKNNGIHCLHDLRQASDFSFVLNGIDFIKPSKGRFRNTEFSKLQLLWEADGATEMARELYKRSRANSYSVLAKYGITDLKLKDLTFREALISLANSDYKAYKKGVDLKYRTKTVRSALLDMKPLFKA